jgi:hypothetical protein
MNICAKHGVERNQKYDKAGNKAGSYCRPCAAERTAARRMESPEKILDERLWAYYRIRLADFRRMFAEQGGKCKACGDAGDSDGRGYDRSGLTVDHDHGCCLGYDLGERSCGKCVRGLICGKCNYAIGHMKESPEKLRALADYLDRTRSH